MSTVDIVIPCYNYAHFLEGCVASVLTQRDVYVRILIINDCSPDNTDEVGKRLAASDPRITYVCNEKNLGLIGTSNRGVMDWASSDYVVLLSADDFLTPGALARATALMDAHPEVSMTYGMALILHDDGPPLEVEDVQDAPVSVVPGKELLHSICVNGNLVPTPSAVMRTSVQHRIGGYNPMFKHTSDVDTWLRAAAAGSIGIVNAVQGLYRWHASNMSAAFQRRPLGDRREMLATCEEFKRRFGDQVPEYQGWLDAMRLRFSREALWIATTSFETPGDDTWRDTLAFAEALNPGYWAEPAWWKLLAKRALGKGLASRLPAAATRLRTTVPAHIFRPDHGLQFGWWPESNQTP